MNQPELTTMDKALVMMAASRGVPIESMAYSSPVPDWKIDAEPSWNWKDMHYRVATHPAPEAKQEPVEPKCVVIVEVFGKDWRLEYMSLPVGRHNLYPQQFTYTHPAPQPAPVNQALLEALDAALEALEQQDYGQNTDVVNLLKEVRRD